MPIRRADFSAITKKEKENMLNNKTFKSLAVATVLAFGSTAFAGAPAIAAAPSMKLQSAVGSTTNFNTLNDNLDSIVVDDDLGLDANDGTYNISAALSLKVFVSNIDDSVPYLNLNGQDGSLFAYTVDTATSGTATDIRSALEGILEDLDADGDLDNTSVAELDSDGLAEIALAEETGWQVVTLYALNDANADDIDSVSVKATLYGEADVTEGMTAGDDYVGPNAVLNFYSPSDVTITTAFDGVEFGDTSVAATFITSPALNHEQVYYYDLYSDMGASIDGLVSSRTYDVEGDNVAELDLALNSSDVVVLEGDVVSTWNDANGVDGGQIISEASYKVQATIYAADEGSDETSAAKYLKITEPEANSLSLEVVSKGNVYDNGTWYVRSGVKTVSIEGEVLDNAADAVSGAVVTIAIESSDMDSDETIKAGGKTYTVGDSDDAIEVEVKTDASGKYALSVTTSTAVDADSFDVTASTPGDASSDTEDSLTAEWEDADFDDWYVTPGDVLGVTATGTVTLNYLVVDQFGEGISTLDDESLKIWVEDNSTAETAISKTVTVSGGKATVSFKNAEEAGTAYELVSYIFVDGTARDSEDIASSWTVETYVWEAASAKVELEDDGEFIDGAVTYEDYVTGTDVPVGAVDYSDILEDGELTVSGYVEDANGNVQPGAPVTLAGKGYLFADINDDVWATDSITVYADATGFFEADVYSHFVADEAKVTVTSGTGSATALVTFDLAGSIDATDVTWKVSGPTYAQSGKTAVVVATLADKWGNGLSGQDVDVALDGIGLLNGDDQISRTTNASGQVKAYLSVSSGDLGTSDLTFTLDDADSEYFDVSTAETDEELDPELTKSTTWGVTYAKASATGNVNVSFGYAKGKRVKIYVDGALKFNVLKKSDTPVTKSYKAAAGSHRVVVKVDGVTIKSKSVTAK